MSGYISWTAGMLCARASGSSQAANWRLATLLCVFGGPVSGAKRTFFTLCSCVPIELHRHSQPAIIIIPQ